MIYPSEQAGLVPGSPKQHERPEKSGFHGNVHTRKRNHAVKFQVMAGFQLNNCKVAEEAVLGYTVATRRMKAYLFTTRRGGNVTQIIPKGNWVEQWALRLAVACLWSVTRISWLS